MFDDAAILCDDIVGEKSCCSSRTAFVALASFVRGWTDSGSGSGSGSGSSAVTERDVAGPKVGSIRRLLAAGSFTSVCFLRRRLGPGIELFGFNCVVCPVEREEEEEIAPVNDSIDSELMTGCCGSEDTCGHGWCWVEEPPRESTG